MFICARLPGGDGLRFLKARPPCSLVSSVSEGRHHSQERDLREVEEHVIEAAHDEGAAFHPLKQGHGAARFGNTVVRPTPGSSSARNAAST